MNDRFQQLFQQQSTTPSQDEMTSLIIFLTIVALIIVFAVVYNYLKRKYNLVIFKTPTFKKRDFNSLCRSVDLNYEETKALYELLDSYNTKNPLTCFTNAKLLDEILKKGLKDLKRNSDLTDQEKIYESSILLEIKAKIESNSRRNTGIRSTHLMAEGQKLVIFARNRGYFYGTIKAINSNHIILEILRKKVTEKILAKDEYIKVYFWREGDAGYVFHSIILDYGNSPKLFQIKHSDKLIRKQKRKYKRIPVNLMGSVYSTSSKIVEEKRRYYVLDETVRNCNIIDLSAGGMKLVVEFIDFKEEIIKINFKLNRNEINIIGKIIRLNKSESLNEVTIQNVKISLEDKNIINEYVYNYTTVFR